MTPFASNPFLFTTSPLACDFTVLMSSVLLYNVENTPNEEKPIKEFSPCVQTDILCFPQAQIKLRPLCVTFVELLNSW